MDYELLAALNLLHPAERQPSQPARAWMEHPRDLPRDEADVVARASAIVTACDEPTKVMDCLNHESHSRLYEVPRERDVQKAWHETRATLHRDLAVRDEERFRAVFALMLHGTGELALPKRT